MTADNFCYWLQGFFELSQPNVILSVEQVAVIKRHLALVFAHDLDPKAGGPEVQEVLNAIHGNKPKPHATIAFDKDTKLRC